MGKDKKVEINKSDIKMWIRIVLLTFPHLKPPYISQIPILDILFDILRVLSVLMLFLWMILKKQHISRLSIMICLLQCYLVVITLLRGGTFRASLLSAISIASIVLLYEISINSRNRKVFYSSQLFCFEIVIYINLITEILYPQTLYITNDTLFVATKCWFLGYYNNHSRYFVPAVLFALLYQKETRKKLRSCLLLIAIICSALLVWSGGVLMSLGSMILVWLFKNRTRLFNYYTYWLLHIIFFVGIIWFKFQNLFEWFLQDILHKWNSLLLRMALWENFLALIMKHPILGYGMQDNIYREKQVGFFWGMHCHNMLLEVLYQGGIIYFLWYVAIITIAGKKLYIYRNTMDSKIISIAFLGWCMHTLVEPFISPFLVGMFIVAYYSNEEECKEKGGYIKYNLI